MRNYKLYSSHYKLCHPSGFTLIEVLITLAITMILTVATVPIYGNFQTSSQINENTTLLIQSLRTAEGRSLSRVNGSSHGIKLFNHSYVLYQGSSYSSRTQAYDRTIDLGNTIVLNWALSGVGQPDEINFSKSLGVPDMIGTITITHDMGNTKTIGINSFGKIEEQ